MHPRRKARTITASVFLVAGLAAAAAPADLHAQPAVEAIRDTLRMIADRDLYFTDARGVTPLRRDELEAVLFSTGFSMSFDGASTPDMNTDTLREQLENVMREIAETTELHRLDLRKRYEDLSGRPPPPTGSAGPRSGAVGPPGDDGATADSAASPAAGRALASGDRNESWRFVMTGRYTRTGDPLRSTGTLDLTFGAGGRVTGTATYDRAGAWDDEVSGTVVDGIVRLEHGGDDGGTRGTFTGSIVESGTVATGEFVIRGLFDGTGTWRATRAPSAGAVRGSSEEVDPETLLLRSLLPTAGELMDLFKRGMVDPNELSRARREAREKRGEAARMLFGGEFGDLTPSQQNAARHFASALAQSTSTDTNGRALFPSMAATLPVIATLARNAGTDPEARVALARYINLLSAADLRNLPARHGSGPRLDRPDPVP